MSSAATARRRFATQTLRLWRDKVGGISGLILDMLIINVTITFILTIVIIRGSSLRSAASVCSHGLPFAHWQSHSHGTCWSLSPQEASTEASQYATCMPLPSDTFHDKLFTYDQGDDADYNNDHEEGLWLCMQLVCLCRLTLNTRN